MANEKLKIDPEFKQICPPLDQETYELLKEDIIRENCVHDPIVVWDDTIVDGHHRYQIAIENNVPFRIRVKHFPNRETAVLWIIRHQLYRRNLKQKFISLLRARLLREVKLPHGGDRKTDEFKGRIEQRNEDINKKVDWVASDLGISSGQSVHLKGDKTIDLLGEHAKVSGKTFQRDESHLKWVEKLHPTLEAFYRGDIVDFSREELKLLASYDHESQLHLYKQVESKKFKTLKDAIAADELESESGPEILMTEEAKVLRSWAARVRRMIDELPDSPWMDDTHRGLIHADLKAAGAVALSRIGAALCPKCESKGCKTCRKTGWLPKMELDQVR